MLDLPVVSISRFVDLGLALLVDCVVDGLHSRLDFLIYS